MAPPAHLKKRTMIKDRVGMVRTTSYDLPGKRHVYGKAEVKDSEDAGVVMSDWVASVPSQPKESQRSFVKTNKFALKDGCITAKSQREFAQAHQNIRFKQPQPKGTNKHYSVPYKGPYGLFNKDQGAGESIRALIEAQYTDWVNAEADYPDLSSLEKKRRLKAPKPTKASAGHDVRSKTVAATEKKEVFKMKKFAAVKSRLYH